MLFLLPLLAALSATQPATAPRAATHPTTARVLIVTGREHPAHNWRETSRHLATFLAEDSRLHVTLVTDPDYLKSPDLATYQTIVLNYMNWQAPDPGDAARANLQRFVANGGGLVLVHFACGAFQGWPEFLNIAGRIWDPKLPPHDPRGAFRVNITHPDHPITLGLADFHTDDELYTCLAGDRPIDLLATATSRLDGKPHPMAFTRTYGQGRVFLSTLGHDVKALSPAPVQTLYRRATAWTAHLPIIEP